MKKQFVEIALIMLLIILMYLQSNTINNFSKSVLGKIIMIAAILCVTHKFGKNAGILAALIVVLNLYNADNLEGVSGKKEAAEKAAAEKAAAARAAAARAAAERAAEARAAAARAAAERAAEIAAAAAKQKVWDENYFARQFPISHDAAHLPLALKMKARRKKLDKQLKENLKNQRIAEQEAGTTYLDVQASRPLSKSSVKRLMQAKNAYDKNIVLVKEPYRNFFPPVSKDQITLDRRLKENAEHKKIAATGMHGGELYGSVERPF